MKRALLTFYFISLFLCSIFTLQAQETPVKKVVCIGNSITAGYGLSNPSTQSYPAVLEGLLGSEYDVINLGVEGATLQKAGHKPYWDLPQYQKAKDTIPDIVILMLGTNDVRQRNIASGFNSTTFKSDLKEMIAELAAIPSNPKIYLCTPSYVKTEFVEATTPLDYFNGTVLRNQVVPAIREVGKELNLSFIDFYALTDGKSGSFYQSSSDKVHPSAAGAKILAEYAHKILTNQLTVTSLTALDFPAAITKVKNTEKIRIVGTNLTGNLSVNISGSGFALPVSTISKALLEQAGGYELEVSTTPVNSNTSYSATITLSGGGLSEDQQINLTATSRELYLTGSAMPYEAMGTTSGTTNTNPERMTVIKGKLIWSGYMFAGDFKFITQLGTWNGNYNSFVQNQTINADGSTPYPFRYIPNNSADLKFKTPAAGYYTISVDMANKSFTVNSGLLNDPDIKNIAFIGNSITAGYKLSYPRKEAYPAVLGDLLNQNNVQYYIFNEGFSGATMQKTGHKPYWDLQEYQTVLNSNPDIIVMLLGTNDARYRNLTNGFNAEAFKQDMKEMIAEVSALPSSPKIYLGIPSYVQPLLIESTIADSFNGTVMHNQVIPAVREVIRELNLDFIDFYELTYGRFPGDWFNDKVHPSAKGATNYANYANKVLTGQPVATSRDTLYFPGAIINVENIEKVVITGRNLTGDLTLSLTGSGYSIPVTTIPKALAEQVGGYELSVSLAPVTSGTTYKGNITVSGGGIEPRVIALEGVGRELYLTGTATPAGLTNKTPLKMTAVDNKLVWSGYLLKYTTTTKESFRFMTQLNTWNGGYEAFTVDEAITTDGTTPYYFRYVKSNESSNKFRISQSGYYTISVDMRDKSFTIKPGLFTYPGTTSLFCIGTGITKGKDLGTSSYPSVLGGLLGSKFDVHNMGVTGRTVQKSTGVSYWDTEEYFAIINSAPDTVVIEFGKNDSRPNYWTSDASYKQNLVEMINSIASLPSNPKIYLTTPTYIEPRIIEYDPSSNYVRGSTLRDWIVPVTRSVAKEKNLELIDLYELTYGRNKDLYTSDGVNPSATGARFIAEYVYKVLDGQPAATTPKEVAFPAAIINVKNSEKIRLTGANLTGNLNISVSGTGFSVSSTTAPKASVEDADGYVFEVSVIPTNSGTNYTGTITISGGGLSANQTISLSATGRELYLTGSSIPYEAMGTTSGTTNTNPERMTIIDGKLVWSGYMAAGNFKLITLLSNWYGYFDAFTKNQAIVADGSTTHYFRYISSESTDPKNNFVVSNAGYYTITIDMQNKSFVVKTGLLNNPSIKNITFIGNSITSGYTLSYPRKEAYPTVLGDMLNQAGTQYYVFNEGFAGATMRKTGHKPYWNLQEYLTAKNSNPNTVILMLGTNDARTLNLENGFDVSAFKQDMKDMINEMSELSPAPKVYVGIPPYVKPEIIEQTSGDYFNGTILRDDVVTAAREIVNELNADFIDFYELTYERNATLYKDKVHPNATGAKALAEYAYKIIKNQPVVTNPEKLSFPGSIISITDKAKVRITGRNLTGDLSLSITGDGFEISETSISKTLLEQVGGYELEVSFTPQAAGNYTGTITISGGGITNQTITLSGTGNKLYLSATSEEITIIDGMLAWSGFLVPGSFKFLTQLSSTSSNCYEPLVKDASTTTDGVTSHAIRFVSSSETTKPDYKFTITKTGFYSIVIDIENKTFTIEEKDYLHMKNIVCVGTGITKWDASTTNNYPEEMWRLMGSEYYVRNFGVTGATLLKGGDKPYWDLPEFQSAKSTSANIIIIEFGKNDSRSSNWISDEESTVEFKQNLIEMISSFTHTPLRAALRADSKKILVSNHFNTNMPAKNISFRANPKIYLATPCYVASSSTESSSNPVNPTVLTNNIAPIIREVATEYDIEIIDFYDATYGRADLFSDGVHLNESGMKVVAEYAKKTINKEPILMVSPSALDFGTKSAGTYNLSVQVNGKNLTDDLTVSITGTNASVFGSEVATITKALVEQTGGYQLNISFTAGSPIVLTTYNAILTVKGTGVEYKINLTGKAKGWF